MALGNDQVGRRKVAEKGRRAAREEWSRMQQDSAPDPGPVLPDADTDTSAAAHLLRLYAAMERLSLIAETTTLGAVARAAQEAGQDLWPVIAHFGGIATATVSGRRRWGWSTANWGKPTVDDLVAAIADYLRRHNSR